MLAVPHLTDGVIRLRVPDRDDVEPIYVACQDPAIVRFTRVPFPYTHVHAQAFVRNSAQELRSGSGAHLVIADVESDALLGVTGLTIDGARRSAEVGYWVAPQCRGQGVASRAVRRLVSWAVHDLELQRVQLMADTRNQ